MSVYASEIILTKQLRFLARDRSSAKYGVENLSVEQDHAHDRFRLSGGTKGSISSASFS